MTTNPAKRKKKSQQLILFFSIYRHLFSFWNKTKLFSQFIKLESVSQRKLLSH